MNYDALHARTLVAMTVALCGILTIFAPNVLSSDSAAAAAATPAPVLTAFATPARHHTTVDSIPAHGHRNSASLSGARKRRVQHTRGSTQALHAPWHTRVTSALHIRIAHPSPLCTVLPTPPLSPVATSFSCLPTSRHRSHIGDLCGLVSGLAFAAWITTCRHASHHRPDAPLAICGSIGTLVVLLPAALLALYRGHGLLWLLDVSPRFIFLVLLDCAAIAAYNIGTMIASRHLPSAELGLYLTLDVVLGPLLVWLVHGEMPSSAVLRGGGLLVSALMAHEAIALISPVTSCRASQTRALAPARWRSCASVVHLHAPCGLCSL